VTRINTNKSGEKPTPQEIAEEGLAGNFRLKPGSIHTQRYNPNVTFQGKKKESPRNVNDTNRQAQARHTNKNVGTYEQFRYSRTTGIPAKNGAWSQTANVRSNFSLQDLGGNLKNTS